MAENQPCRNVISGKYCSRSRCSSNNSTNLYNDNKLNSRGLKSNTNKPQRSASSVRGTKTISFEVPVRTSECRRPEQCRTEPDSTSISFMPSKKNMKIDQNVCQDCQLNDRKTWYDVLKDENTNIVATHTCSNNSTNFSHHPGTLISSDPIHFLNSLVNRLYEKVCERSDQEILYLVGNIKSIVTCIPCTDKCCDVQKGHRQIPRCTAVRSQILNEHDDNRGHCTSEKNNGNFSDCNCNDSSKIHQVLKPQIKKNDSCGSNCQYNNLINAKIRLEDQDGCKGEPLKEMNRNIASVRAKTDECGKNIQALQNLLLNIHGENKMINEMKDIRCNLEKKLAMLSYENKFLKKELQVIKQDREKDAVHLENKKKEISHLKEQIMKVRNMIHLSKSNVSLKKTSLQNVSSHFREIDRIPRPVSSSPIDLSLYEEELVAQKESAKSDNDSGIQSNTPCNNPPTTNSNSIEINFGSFKNNLDGILADLKNNLKINDEDLQLYLPNSFVDTDASLCLSENTYKYSIASNITE